MRFRNYDEITNVVCLDDNMKFYDLGNARTDFPSFRQYIYKYNR